MSYMSPLRLDLPADPIAAHAARVALAALTASAEASLVVGELVTNAVVHGAPPITLSAIPHGRALRVEVHDGRPDLGPPAADSRGLRLVEAVALQWGVQARADGKVVWADLRI
jgi:anti-sigma regulatory factor (Ser/Thr protein kinase)